MQVPKQLLIKEKLIFLTLLVAVLLTKTSAESESENESENDAEPTKYSRNLMHFMSLFTGRFVNAKFEENYQSSKLDFKVTIKPVSMPKFDKSPTFFFESVHVEFGTTRSILVPTEINDTLVALQYFFKDEEKVKTGNVLYLKRLTKEDLLEHTQCQWKFFTANDEATMFRGFFPNCLLGRMRPDVYPATISCSNIELLLKPGSNHTATPDPNIPRYVTGRTERFDLPETLTAAYGGFKDPCSKLPL
ncbi:uncharacterized protein LOC131930981 [Physella acuta]|uniref:uncharacterized protein LOC131930981 n=1 Tax=Physella acuta TaxID=109671 RepID=UPI0027DD6050|nr:uncharacterized protein LOC131930981 [Physella acuta]XP_059143635.1 uncharacterized protein LOC131930981 [Physella acuta]XP_059143636.1 uncharacterized protein LOC131930981 [Physella acuta]